MDVVDPLEIIEEANPRRPFEDAFEPTDG